MAYCNLLNVLRLFEFLAVNTAMELDSLQTNPFLSDDWNNVMATHNLSSLLPHVIDAQIHVRHSCVPNRHMLFSILKYFYHPWTCSSSQRFLITIQNMFVQFYLINKAEEAVLLNSYQLKLIA